MTAGNSASNVFYMANARKKPRPAEMELEAARLLAKWNERQRERRFTQTEAAEAMGIKQTMVSHYINGRKPLGDTALLRFCQFLNIQPTEIRPLFRFANLMPSDLTPEQVEVAKLWQNLPNKLRETWKLQLKETVQNIGPRKT